jgi:hypothetical protein
MENLSRAGAEVSDWDGKLGKGGREAAGVRSDRRRQVLPPFAFARVAISSLPAVGGLTDQLQTWHGSERKTRKTSEAQCSV